MNKLQEQSLQANDARYITEIVDEGFAANNASHAKTQALLGELLKNSAQSYAKAPPLSLAGAALNREFYNLFVIGGEDFNNGVFSVQRTTVFMSEFIEPDIKRRFQKLRDDSVVRQILSFPSLFMDENSDYMLPRPGQRAFFGRVTDFKINKNDIRVSFHADTQIFQQRITDISHNLGIIGNPGCSELNNTHWTIKRLDLIKVLMETEILVLRDKQAV